MQAAKQIKLTSPKRFIVVPPPAQTRPHPCRMPSIAVTAIEGIRHGWGRVCAGGGTTMKRFGLVSLICFAACIPEHDYEGDYEMTYDLVVAYGGHRDAHAGTELVRVHHGIDEEYLVDLGSSFCRLTATYVAAELYSDWPYLSIPPQDCWYQSQPI